MSETLPALPSATILLLRQADEVEVLMVERGKGAYYGSALVFPGGKVDETDRAEDWASLVDDPSLDPEERALRVAGLRELHEETGLTLAQDGSVTGSAATEASFADVVRQAGGRLPVSAMRRLARWITPLNAPKRFDTHFFLCRYDGGEARSDGFETVSTHWISPRAALEQGADGRHKLLFPTRCQLQRIAQLDSVDAIFAHADAHPAVAVQVALGERDGRRVICIPEDANYPVCEEVI